MNIVLGKKEKALKINYLLILFNFGWEQCVSIFPVTNFINRMETCPLVTETILKILFLPFFLILKHQIFYRSEFDDSTKSAFADNLKFTC